MIKSIFILVILFILVSCTGLQVHEKEKILFVEKSLKYPDSLSYYLESSNFNVDTEMQKILYKKDYYTILKNILKSSNHQVFYDGYDLQSALIITSEQDRIMNAFLRDTSEAKFYVSIRGTANRDWQLTFFWKLFDSTWYYQGVWRDYSLEYMESIDP
jgi:hypothetical protein